MRKVLVLLYFFTICTLSYGQILTEKNIIGKWSVTKVTSTFDKMNLPESAMKDINVIKKSFHNSIFEFKENGQFFIKFVKEDSYNSDLKKLNGNNWKLNRKNALIKIVDKDKEESELISFPIVDKFPNAKFSIGGVVQLHMKKGVFNTEADYDKTVVSNKTNEKSIEEKRKETYGEDLYELKKASEAREAISYDDIKIIDGIAYFKDSNSLVELKKIEERYENGKLKMEGWFLNGKEDQVWTWYYRNGTVSQEKIFKEGKLDGFLKEWNENGQLTSKVNFKGGIKVDD